MNLVGLVHTLFGFSALVFGALVLALRKGTRRHRQVGRLYVASMVLLNGTAFLIYRLFDGFGPFHWLALVSLATVVAGLAPAVCRRPRGGWLELHARLMAWSYVGLLAAAASEVTTRLLSFPFGWTVALSSVAVFVFGGVVVERRVPAVVRELRGGR